MTLVIAVALAGLVVLGMPAARLTWRITSAEVERAAQEREVEEALDAMMTAIAALGAGDDEAFCDVGVSPLLQQSMYGLAHGDCLQGVAALNLTPAERAAARAGFDVDAVEVDYSPHFPGYACFRIPAGAWKIPSEPFSEMRGATCLYEDQGDWYVDGPRAEDITVEDFAASVISVRADLGHWPQR